MHPHETAYAALDVAKEEHERRLAETKREEINEAKKRWSVQQAERAATIAKRQTLERDNNGESIFYQTGWVKILDDVSTDQQVQASLRAVYSIERALRLPALGLYIPFKKKLSCVHLYMRPAIYDGSVASPEYSYPVLFNATSGEIRLDPSMRDATTDDSKRVLLETPEWGEIDHVLKEFERLQVTN